MATEIPAHDLAGLFSLGPKDELKKLTKSIKTLGQQVDIFLYEGKVLDGRRRQKACIAAGVEPRYREWNGECGTPENFVEAMNLDRRHDDLADRVQQLIELGRRREARQHRKDLDAGQERLFPAEAIVDELAADNPAIADMSPEEQLEAIKEAESAPRRTGVDEDDRAKQEPRSVRKWANQFMDLNGTDGLARARAHARLDETWDALIEERKKKRKGEQETVPAG